jgi:hypothetical protein
MKENPQGWEIVSRHGNYGGWVALILHFVILTPPSEPNTITITVREKSTGLVYSVTAANEREARARLAEGKFD